MRTKRNFSFLDSEQRIITAKVIKRFILHAKKMAFVIEHDFIMATYLADRVIVFEGSPAVAATATPYGSFFFFCPCIMYRKT
jgi:ATP-binding cassette subfamily E protein 1